MTLDLAGPQSDLADDSQPPRPGFVVWLTGLSGAGKSTIAAALAAELQARGVAVEVLDGDEVRTNLSRGLGYSKEDRDTNVRRIGYVSRLLARNGVAVVTAVISPYAQVRDEIRNSVESEAHFIEVHVDCSIEELTRRDTKGLYEQAQRGTVTNLSGVSDPYERPADPDVHVNSEQQTVPESLSAILELLAKKQLIPLPKQR